MRQAAWLAAMVVAFLAVAGADAAIHPSFNQQVENSTTQFDLYYFISGSQFVNGQTVNGDNASGGVFRFIHDDPAASYPMNVWNRDDWFPENAGIALTMKNAGTTVYDNNLIESGAPYGPNDYYNNELNTSAHPIAGLYMGYEMSNNDDWVYASYFKLTEDTVIDTIVGYFDGTGYNGGFDPNDPSIAYRMNIWSAVEGEGADAGYLMPTNTGSFQGDVFSSDLIDGVFSWSDTGVSRHYSGWGAGVNDPIYRLVYTLDEPITLPAGEYFFSHDAAIVPEAGSLVVWSLLAGLASFLAWRRKRAGASAA